MEESKTTTRRARPVTSRAPRAAKPKAPSAARGSKAKAAPAAPDRRGWIATAAYFRAERRGFAPGGEIDDWLAAEAEIAVDAEHVGTARPARKPARRSRKPAG